MTDIYRDIAERTHGDVYIGVVGPVRTGKSTFIKRFMEAVVLPNIRNEDARARARDELPQSAGGKTVMTTEPKFIPDEGVEISADGTSMRVKLVDCVGYMIPDVIGGEEDGAVRMVHTPWHAEPVPFGEAAEYGTRKVITDHATVGVLVTSDGSVGDLPRENYTGAEERVAAELAALGKPYVIVLNSAHPEAEESVRLAEGLEDKYGAPVALLNCAVLDADDVYHILGMLLDQFPAKQVDVLLPAWVSALPEDHALRAGLRESVASAVKKLGRLSEVGTVFAQAVAEGFVQTARAVGSYPEDPAVRVMKTDAGSGTAELAVSLPDGLYYDVISALTSIPMKNEEELIDALRRLAAGKKEIDRYREAIEDVNARGYGIVMPEVENLRLEEPEIIRQSGAYGVRLRASAPSIHMIRTDIKAEISPVVGTEEQSEEMVKTLMEGFENDPASIWESKMFGRTLYDLINDGLHLKLAHLPDDARQKFGETLSKVINEGSSGLICIIL